MKGKLIPTIMLGSGAHVKTNFGAKTFKYGIPELCEPKKYDVPKGRRGFWRFKGLEQPQLEWY